MQEFSETSPGRDRVRRSRPVPSSRGPRRWQVRVPVALVAAVGWVLVPGGSAHSADRDPAAELALLAAQGQACPEPGNTIRSPGTGVVLRPGRVPAAGTTAAGASVEWVFARPDGTVAESGVVSADATDGTYAVQVDLPPGDWTVVTRASTAAGDPGACTWTSVPFSVSETVEGATWTAGASGGGVASGEFAAWRGSPVTMSGTWADSNDGQVELWTLQPGAEFGDWDGALDVAIGAIGPGETWAQAAAGAYDARWAASLQEMASLRADRTGTTYIRFAHEMNGNWYPWSVPQEATADFIAAWQRYRALQVQYFPGARLVFEVNSQTPYDWDWRTLFPGSQYVDVVSVSYFNSFPGTADVDGFWERATRRNEGGAPEGIQGFLDFAHSVGLPLAVSEWGPHGDFGDAPVYMEQMYQFFRANAGTGPGQVLYEVLFNVDVDHNPFAVHPATNVPLAAEAYQRLW